MFVVLTDIAYVTRAINTDAVSLFVLTDAGQSPPYQPTIDILMQNGDVIKQVWIPTVDQPTPATASHAIYRFFHETIEGRE
jgi:hypothetical protein